MEEQRPKSFALYITRRDLGILIIGFPRCDTSNPSPEMDAIVNKLDQREELVTKPLLRDKMMPVDAKSQLRARSPSPVVEVDSSSRQETLR